MKKKIKLSKKILGATLVLGLSTGLAAVNAKSINTNDTLFGMSEINFISPDLDQIGDHKCGEGKCGGDHKCGEDGKDKKKSPKK